MVIVKVQEREKKMRRMLEHKELSVEVINAELLNKNRVKLISGGNYIPIDGSDLRKKKSEKIENLMKVRDLDGKFVNGYRTINAVLIQKNHVQLLSSIPYSSNAEDFKSENELTLNLIDKIDESVDRGDNHITYLLDSKYDDQKYFEKIESYKDFFITRAKYLNRIVINKAGKSVSLSSLKYRSIGVMEYKTIFVSGKKYHDIRAYFSYANMVYNKQNLTVINVELKTQKNKKLFKKPFYLLTNINYKRASKDRITNIYHAYLKRWKIELVFKFLKTSLGWEKFGLKNYEANKKLITMVFMVAAYLYEIENISIDKDIIAYLAYLGRGKGTISKKYLLQGIETLITINKNIEILKENYTEEQINEMHNALNIKRMF